MADTDLSAATRPEGGGYSWHGVTDGVTSIAPSAVTMPSLTLLRAISVQFFTELGYVGRSAVAVAGSDRVMGPESAILEIWRRGSNSAPDLELVLYLLGAAATAASIILEWAD